MLDVAVRYRRDEGWYPVPIPYGEKGPTIPGWQNLRLETPEQIAAHFNGAPQNIGVILGACSRHTVDTDFDQPECLAFGRWLLPPTRIFGRPSNINSHWLFQSVTDATRIQFFVMIPSPDGKAQKRTFLELRANEHQTVFPGSLHGESGELIRWTNNLPLTEISFDELRRRAGWIAAGAALAQAWPRQKGCRHNCELALAGMLLRSGFTDEDAEQFIRTIATIANSDNASGRAHNAVTTTSARLTARKPVTGWRTLSKLLNEPALLGKVCEWVEYPEPTREAEQETASEHRETRLHVVTGAELLKMEFPPREYVLGPILQTQSTSMLFSRRGVGKTYLGLGIACAIASGPANFLRWNAPKARKVLYVDGEMPGVTMQERFAAVVAGFDTDMDPSYFRLITPDLQPEGIPSLSGTFGQSLIEDQLDDAEILILDNVSTLCRGGKENEAESWLPIQEWVLSLRRRGKSVVLVHHAGRNGEARGTSKREDVLDTIITLRHPEGYTPDEGARFELHYTKSRGFFGKDAEPFEVRMETQNGAALWFMSSLEDLTEAKVRELLDDGFSIRETAKELNIHRSRVERIKNKIGGAK